MICPQGMIPFAGNKM